MLTQPEPVLVTSRLTKHFGLRVAVDSLALEVCPGEVFGLLGPNGSGKSTTVGMLLGLIRPSSGTVRMFGKDLWANRWEVLKHVGAIVESPAFYPYLSGRQNLDVFARPLGCEDQIPLVLSRVGLSDRADDEYRSYSLGMKQRLGIALALVRDPRLVILDEPTNGLDPAGTREVRDLIPRLAAEGRAVILCSHLLHEVELMCDRLAILNHGRRVWQGAIDEITGRSGALRLRVDDDVQCTKAAAMIREMPGLKVEKEGPFLTVAGPRVIPAELNLTLNLAGVMVSELIPLHPSLESVFLELTGGAVDLP